MNWGLLKVNYNKYVFRMNFAASLHLNTLFLVSQFVTV